MKNHLKFCFVISTFWLAASFGAARIQASYENGFAQTPERTAPQKQSPGRTGEETRNQPAGQTGNPTPRKADNNNTDKENRRNLNASQPPLKNVPNDAPPTVESGGLQTAQPINAVANKPVGNTNNNGSGESFLDGLDIWKLLSWLLTGLVGLLVLVAVGWFVRYVLTTIGSERQANLNAFGSIKSKQKDFQHHVEELGKTVKLLSSQLTQQQTTIQSLQNQLKASGGNVAHQPQSFHEPPIFKPEPQFPVAAEDYLNKNRSNALTAAVDHYTNKLVQDANKGDEFLIVKDNGLANDLLYAVPNVARFSTKGDYLTYYQNYYACENPSGGAVWIKSPTTVRRVDGGWQLEEMGELEIR